MKVALVHDWLTGMRGGEKCLEVLCRRFPDARLFSLLHVRGSTSRAIEQMPIATSFLQRFPRVGSYHRYLLPLMPAAVESLRIPPDVDLVVSLSHAVAKSVKPPPGVPHVCYCFTPMRYAWHRRADYLQPAGRRRRAFSAAGNLVLDRIKRWDRRTSDRVTQFVAISRTVQQRIAESYGRPSEVIYPPVDTSFFMRGTPPPEEGRLGYACVSALVPYKRVDLAIEACNRLGRRLVVIGSGPERRRLAKLAGPTVTLAGWATNEQIRDHLRRCRALLFPGHEDFGIVPLEAQACGTPVVALGRGGATETVLEGNATRPGTGLFFDNQTAESLAEAMLRLESHPHWFDSHLARRQATRFATDRFEAELVGHLTRVVNGRRIAGSVPPEGPPHEQRPAA